MAGLQLREVFTAGGIPTVTYVPREEKDAERQIEQYLLTGHTILSITGPSKSGKTVLCRRKIPDETRVDVAGGQTRDLLSFWSQIADALDVPQHSSKSTSSGTSRRVEGKAGASADWGFAKLSLGGKADRSSHDHAAHDETALPYSPYTDYIRRCRLSKGVSAGREVVLIGPDKRIYQGLCPTLTLCMGFLEVAFLAI